MKEASISKSFDETEESEYEDVIFVFIITIFNLIFFRFESYYSSINIINIKNKYLK